MPIRNRFAELLPEITAWRRDFHAHPELHFECHRTASIVAEKLREFGCDEVVEGIAVTGLVGLIHGRSRESGRVVGLRADMDALPITEATGKPYASIHHGKMHACGHDGHTAMLLGAAKYLCETRNFDGTVAVIFQPAEEGGAGAKVMCDAGLMDRFGIHEVYGMHNRPGHPLGEFNIRSGAFYAACDEFRITVEGRGGHAAKPHATVDPTLAASHLIVALQSIASRNTDPTQNIVLSVCGVRTDTQAHNVIAQRVELRGTIRTHNAEIRQMAEARLHDIARATAAAFGARADVEFMQGYPVMVNHDTETQIAREVALAVSNQCLDAGYNMGGEDFAYMLEERPGAYIVLGAGDGPGLHHPEYDFNDETIPYGCSWFVGIAETRLAS
ncbi:M20 aminoacylase family protein [Roseinatronobacter bogoriensis]|uniref:Amidohydrolase n=1 Tax=Roseinatronobacter bogoriensis subsp. barguzinensis TaxID=441209 RepID=A0A2K8KA64_9RHOB|nr:MULTISPECIES: M20 aminoacylase family protein [Rhodobaca]ATX66314.1 amidohydrolase [Rhodobaca barguzinensis]MBB4207443.1 hippurate hydrolase [Rhodobaca bogoriensis DSM 18756]TDW40250.1 hippurate hydrolase [Rhodobaca barguzinensis]TDY70598.1 hippurate hydrolase [Rhodobaca bogoriensis DSM 18756]